MFNKLGIDLHQLANFVNLALPVVTLAFFAAGLHYSFFFHFGTVAFGFITLLNMAYRFVQTRHTILRNFGIMGQARYMIESIGPELRQYLFASDTEERPFNRTERAEVYRKAKAVDSASSFGSMADFDAGAVKIRHTMFPLSQYDLKPYELTFGEERGLDTAYTISRPIMISAMSYGALGENAVRALARGAKMAGIAMNTGEGGFPKYHLEEGCDLIFQMGTAKFGVREPDGTLDDNKLREIAALPAVKMIEVKFSQGAKPGKGGLLPKEKITDEIAELRGVSKDHDIVSPPSHPECRDTASTVAFIKRVQDVSGLPVGIKLCLGAEDELRDMIVEMKATGVFPDYIAIDGAEGGTGAAPKPFMDLVGVPVFPALQVVNRILIEEGVRERTKLVASGKLISAGRQLVAMALGADAIYSARGFMLALGCIQALQCGNNTCPIGITTHDPKLQHGLVVGPKAERVKNYVEGIDHDFREMMAASGCRTPRELTEKNLYVPADSDLYRAHATKPLPQATGG